MTDSSPITTAIIYTAGTVDRLVPFLDSLLDHTTGRFRLATNGCLPGEVEQLRRRAARLPDRLEVVTVSEGVVLPHGDALDRLLAAETEPFFSILDSDVLAVPGASPSELVPPDGVTAVCSCLPLWHRTSDAVMPAGSRVMGGRYLWSSDGTPLGCTYAATYRTGELRATLEAWGVALRPYRWNELPRPVRTELTRRGLRCAVYDTAKVANILLHADGRRVEFVESPRLLHVGAQSGLRGDRSRAGSITSGPRRVRRIARAIVRRVRQGPGLGEQQSTRDLRRRRRAAVRLVDALAAGDVEAAAGCDWLDEPTVRQLSAVLAPSEVGAERWGAR